MAQFDKTEIMEIWSDIRNDNTDTNWGAFVYDGKKIVPGGQGVDYQELFDLMAENNDRVYAYVRVETGDEMSKRMKFALIFFLGENVKPIDKARCSTDKSAIKTVLKDFAKEFTCDCKPPTLDEIVTDLRKAGGANYNAQNA